MIAPEVRGGGNGETDRRLLLRKTLFAVVLVFLALQVWRPLFFLTDDNLDGGLPFFTEMGHHLLAGRSPYFSDYLFGGHYYLLRDPACFLWHPLYLVGSLLANTPLHFWIVDVDAFALLLLTAAGFVNLAWYLRRDLKLTISDGWILFYTLSFTYSMAVLTMAASWINFLAAQSALPWLALGILQRSWRCSFGLLTLFSMHQILGSHLHPTISSGIYFSIFAAGVSLERRSWQPLACWVGGYTVAIIVLLPLVFPIVGGFFASERSHGMGVADMSRNNISFLYFPTSLFFGIALWLFRHLPYHYIYNLALGSSAAPWCVLATVAGRGKWTRLEGVLVVMLLIIGLMICRPEWLGEMMARLPLFKSMRWPFRELLQFQFFFHLLMVIRRPGFSALTRYRLAFFGSTVYILPLLFYGLPPTFNVMKIDRDLILSGGFEQYWQQVRPFFKPDDRMASIIPEKVYFDGRYEEPYSLISSYNYPIFSRVTNVWGWSITPPIDRIDTRVIPYYPFGAYTPDQEAALLAEQPGLKFITLESLHPLRISLSSRNGPTIDLTPFIPAATKTYVESLKPLPVDPNTQ